MDNRGGEASRRSRGGKPVYSQFGLVLTVTHACNLRCDYCYACGGSPRVMPERVGRRAIQRAVASLALGGTLELGFFGGEPLLVPDLVGNLIEYTREQTAPAGMSLKLRLTTNGTVTDGRAWSVMLMPGLDLAISHDGLPAVHDRHRRFGTGHGTSEHVMLTIGRLIHAGRDFSVVMVVRPDTVESLAEGIEFLRAQGVRRIQPTLDLWAEWSEPDLERLENAIAECRLIGSGGWLDPAIAWMDEAGSVRAAGCPSASARCGFGDGELAVAPSGRLYPCERLIGHDPKGHPLALPGHATEGLNFVPDGPPPPRTIDRCESCLLYEYCNATCPCSNFIRTGDIRRPDRLLCTWNQACLTETARVLGQKDDTAQPPVTKENSHV
jgi:uncharacterized protein